MGSDGVEATAIELAPIGVTAVTQTGSDRSPEPTRSARALSQNVRRNRPGSKGRTVVIEPTAENVASAGSAEIEASVPSAVTARSDNPLPVRAKPRHRVLSWNRPTPENPRRKRRTPGKAGGVAAVADRIADRRAAPPGPVGVPKK